MKTLANNRKSSFAFKELLVIILFYLFFSILYHIVLWYNGYWNEQASFFGWLDLKRYWYEAGMQYSIFFLASLLIWLFIKSFLKNKSSVLQITVVLALIPVAVYLSRLVRYSIVNNLGIGRLRGTGTVWDLYIPLLFLLIQFGCFFAYRYFKENQRKLRVEGELRQAALKSELSAIKAQLNPHFLYNVFNTINASIPEEHEKTRQMIAQLSDLFRYQLKAAKEDLVSLKDEVDFVEKYLELEKARFGDRLFVQINVPAQLLDEKVPPLILQPLVENSVKHGLSSLIEGGSISITISKEADKLKFEIADTGIGVADTSLLLNKGIGLTNTVLRLQKMYNSQLNILANEPRGLKIQFSI